MVALCLVPIAARWPSSRWGQIAGTASAMQCFVTASRGALIGFFIGQQFDGTTGPLMLGFAACGVLVLCMVLFAEGGRLFRPRQRP
jgi:DHA1 family bicyclomycin/chloramphenicol resistance-like MFS transporter